MTMKKNEEFWQNNMENIKYTDADVEIALFSNGLKFEDYFLDQYGAICFTNKRGVEMEWLFEDDSLVEACKHYLQSKNVTEKFA